MYGPKLPISQEKHAEKYRGNNESFEEAMTRVANALADDKTHFRRLRDILLDMRFLPAGRVQSAMGSPRETTPYNCFVSGTFDDSMASIMEKAAEAAETMRLGGGIGYDFSPLRPRGDLIRSLESRSSGPLSFMTIFDALCMTIASAGHRRGAQMGVLRVDHPDIEDFIEAKTNRDKYTQFNLSVGVTDEFMEALRAGANFDLRFEGRSYGKVKASALWDKIMRATWDWAEPGVLFIDKINRKNNLYYCETIAATNPCGEQPLPPYGACLLGSFNLVKYISPGISVTDSGVTNYWQFDTKKFIEDISVVVRAMDNIIDRAIYPLPQHKLEAQSKRRMGLGVTGVANALEIMGAPYGSENFMEILEFVLENLRNTAYQTSIELAKEKGAFPVYDDPYIDSGFMQTMPEDIRNDIFKYGIRNSHLLSIAPTGTISLTADNISSGIEPVFSYKYDRTIQEFNGARVEEVTDYAYREFGVQGRTADEVSGKEHVSVLTLASKYVDSACSKTCNVGAEVTWEEFKDLYLQAYEGGASGCTTFRSAGLRYGILNAKPSSEEEEGSACYFDPLTGQKSCG